MIICLDKLCLTLFRACYEMVSQYPGKLSWYQDSLSPYRHTAWKVSVYGVFRVRIFPHLGSIQIRKTPNTDTFHAVISSHITWLDLKDRFFIIHFFTNSFYIRMCLILIDNIFCRISCVFCSASNFLLSARR